MHENASSQTLRSIFTEDYSGKMASFVPDTLCFKRSIRDIADLLDCSATEEQVEQARKRLTSEQLVTKCIHASRITQLLIDDGLDYDCKSIEWHGQFTQNPAKRIFRIEAEAEKLLSNPKLTLDTLQQFTEHIRNSIKRDPTIVGLKSICAYRSGLDVHVYLDKAMVEEVYGEVRKAALSGSSFRLTRKLFIDYLVHQALEVSQELQLPVQFHCGFGDADLALQRANPVLLKPIFDEPKFSRAKVVLLHAAYPYTQELGYLASLYPQVFVDIGLAFPRLSVNGMRTTLQKIMELCPSSKILYSSDGVLSPELLYCSAKWIRILLVEVLEQSIKDQELTTEEAFEIAKQILHDNAAKLYRLPQSIMNSEGPLCTTGLAAISELKAKGCRFLRLVWNGTEGMVRTKAVSISSVDEKLLRNGVGLTQAVFGLLACGDMIAPDSNVAIAEDMWMVPDMQTLQQLPHHTTHAMALVKLQSFNGRSSEFCSRTRAMLQVDKLRSMGYEVYCGFENEFTLYDEHDKPLDQTNYAQTDAFHGKAAGLMDEMAEVITQMGSKIWLVHPESAYGQFEITVAKELGLHAADMQLFLKEAIKGVSQKHGMKAYFLPKMHPMQAGNGCHMHLSLWKDGENIFKIKKPTASDCKSGESLNPVAKHFMAGILTHLPAIMAITCATPTSFERLAPHCWSGAFQCWGVDNKEAALRLPRDRNTGSFSNVEVKTVDSTANPHFALTVLLAAGIDGIQNQTVLPPAMNNDPGTLSDEARSLLNIKRLPTTLSEALDYLEKDHVLIEALGKTQATAYIAVKREEIKQFGSQSLSDQILLLRDRY